jgi:hypothetical protein
MQGTGMAGWAALWADGYAGPRTQNGWSGARLAVDHVGSSVDSIHHTRQLEPDIIKRDHDRNLVAGIDTDMLCHAFGTALTGFTGHLGVTLIAKGSKPAMNWPLSPVPA